MRQAALLEVADKLQGLNAPSVLKSGGESVDGLIPVKFVGSPCGQGAVEESNPPRTIWTRWACTVQISSVELSGNNHFHSEEPGKAFTCCARHTLTRLKTACKVDTART